MSSPGEFARLKGALFTTDAQVLSVMNQVLDNFEIDTEVCIDPQTALETVGTIKLDTLIMDWIGKDSTEILRALRESEHNGKATVLAMVSGDVERQAATNSGANFTMYKPLNADQATRFLRVAYGSMLLQRRRVVRCQVDISVVIDVAGAGTIEARIIDLSIKGLAFRCTHDIRIDQHLTMQFKLPETNALLHVSGRVANVSTSTSAIRVGVCFFDVPQSEYPWLEQWVSDHLPKLPEVLTSSDHRGKTLR